MKVFLLLTVFYLTVCQFSSVSAQEGAVWQVTKYDVAATLPTNATDRVLSAKAIVSLKNIGRGAGSTATFRINQKAEFTAAEVGGATASFRKIADDKLAGLQRYTVSLPASVQPNGATVVTISYRLTVGENNGLTAISTVGSQFLPLAVWYPTPTNPYSPRGADYAAFRLSVIAPNGETVVSSGKANGAAFEQNLNAQPFFVTGNYEIVEGSNGVLIYLPKGMGAAERSRAAELANLANAANLFAANLLGAAAAAPIRLVAVQRGAGFSDGGTILLDEAVFRRPKIDSATVLTIAEAVTKVWLGNQTILRGEGYGAIQDGLARFVATQFIEKQFGKDAADIERLRQRTSYSAVAKREDDPPLALNSPSIQTYFASVPNKGAMIWRLAAREIGEEKFFAAIRQQLQTGRDNGLTLPQFRQALNEIGGEKLTAILNYGLDQPTDTDLLVGLPQTRGAETAAALRNTGGLPATVNVTATTDKGEILSATVNIAAKNFGEVVFRTSAKIVNIEIDREKLYPQLDYSNDIVPRETAENDQLAQLAAIFNRQEYAKAEAAARKALFAQPHFDEARTWLGRALLEQNRLDEAEKEFTGALSEKLLAVRTLAWANIGLGEIAVRRSQNQNAVKFFDAAVKADAEYASNIAARQNRLKVETATSIDEAAKNFFAAFDKAVLTTRKAEVDNLILNGELAQFSGRLTGNQPELWQTKLLRTEPLDANRIIVETNLNVKLINKDTLGGFALFTLTKTANGLKIAKADLNEIR